MDQPASNNDWLTAQQKYWDAWLELTRQSLNGAPASKQTPGTWSDGLLKWWEAVSPTAPPASQDLFGRLMGMSQSYVGMAEHLANSGQEEPTAVLDRWLDSMNAALRTVGEGANGSTGPDARAARAFFDLPLDMWRRTTSSSVPLPGDFLHAAHVESAAKIGPHITAQLDRLLAIPAVGHSREAQDQQRRLLRLMLDYSRVLQDYNAAFARVGLRAIETFRHKLHETTSSPPIDSLRKLYDLWIDICEQVYAEYVMTDDYRTLYARLTNALIAVKQQGSVLVDEVLESMNMPSRRETNTMHQRMHEMRRENRALRAEMQKLKDKMESSSARETASGSIGPRRKTAHE